MLPSPGNGRNNHVPLRIVVCHAQVPFEHGGTEILAESLVEQLRQRGHLVDLVHAPQSWATHEQILANYLIWRLTNLDTTQDGQPIDRVIALKVPSYAVRHKHKVTWLIQQFRQCYDLYGTPYSGLTDSPEDQELRATIRRMDTRTINESKHVFAISQNVANRLHNFNGLTAEVLYPPPSMEGRYYNDSYGDYVLSVSRLDPLKRVDLLVRAMSRTRSDVRCLIVGRGPEQRRLQELVRKHGLADRIEFLGFVANADLIELYANALALFYAPIDEDYGLVTIEAMKSDKPVITAKDSGGVLEFVEQDTTGAIFDPDDIDGLASAIDRLAGDHGLARRLGEQGRERVAGITWDATINRLLEV